ncbi:MULTISPECIES: hypothetical protein [unclassified Hydrogenophaga]|mgnify:FL=1|jgi:hypothetical protein|uniref:hypothetical protein n=1 Tax=unclassified Hydrogenophaga TaxID=2610897 RepID=UPI001F1BDEE5|nr:MULTISPECIES: hypothetical protein [unclassified Hydrogenophaga]
MTNKNAKRTGMASSVVSYPDRGPWGNSKWRGNASGHLYRELFEQVKPKVFVDPMVGGGTSIEVAQEMGIEAYGLDLFEGFDAVSDDILTKVGKHADLIVSHAPYSGMIKYAGPGGMWGDKNDPADLSQCIDDADFHEKMQMVLLNQRRATRPGGYYGTLIGDWRRGGKYTCYMAEMLARMPSNELAAVIIKTQHNCVSDFKSYGAMKMPRIQHEYLCLWEKRSVSAVVLLSTIVKEGQQRVSGTWKNIVRLVLQALGGVAPLEKLYAAIAAAAPEQLKTNQHWRAKVRQTLQLHADIFQRKQEGVWAVA